MKTPVARFNSSPMAEGIATMLNAGSDDGATFTVEWDPSSCRSVIYRNEEAAETPFTIEDFVAALQAKSDAYYAENFPSMDKPTYGVSAPGKKFQRVWVESYGQTSVHCFVNRDGWVYKAASWKAPASGVRYPSMEAAAEAFNGNGTGYLYAK